MTWLQDNSARQISLVLFYRWGGGHRAQRVTFTVSELQAVSEARAIYLEPVWLFCISLMQNPFVLQSEKIVLGQAGDWSCHSCVEGETTCGKPNLQNCSAIMTTTQRPRSRRHQNCFRQSQKRNNTWQFLFFPYNKNENWIPCKLLLVKLRKTSKIGDLCFSSDGKEYSRMKKKARKSIL